MAVRKTPSKKGDAKKPAAKKPAAKKSATVKVALKKTNTPKPKVAARKPSVASEKTKDYKSDKYASFLSGNAKYFNRELSWIEFDERILHEARDIKNPLLERLNFLSITASNLDEFYIVRVASLRDMQSIEFTEKDIAGFTVSEQLERIDEKTRKLMSLMYSTYGRTLVPALAQEKIFLKDYSELGKAEQQIADSYFKNVLYPVLTPMAVDSSRPFPLIYNRMLNMCVMLENDPDRVRLQDKAQEGITNSKKKGSSDKEENEKHMYATVQIPTVVKRLYQIPTGEGDIFVPIEQIIMANVNLPCNEKCRPRYRRGRGGRPSQGDRRAGKTQKIRRDHKT